MAAEAMAKKVAACGSKAEQYTNLQVEERCAYLRMELDRLRQAAA